MNEIKHSISKNESVFLEVSGLLKQKKEQKKQAEISKKIQQL